MNTGVLDSLEFPYPPVELQDQFRGIAAKVESVKSHYLKSLTDLETLYSALSQRAFKAELNLSRVSMTAILAENKQIVAAEPLHKPAADSRNIRLPEIGVLLDEVQGPVRQQDMLRFWLEACCRQLGGTSFSVQHFMGQAQARLAELHPDNDFELSAADYEHIKAWVFEALGAGRLAQSINVTHNDEDTGEPIFGNMIQLRASQS